MVEGGGFEPPKLSWQIYSLLPLATREPLHKCGVNNIDPHQPCKQKKQLFLKFIAHQFCELKLHTFFWVKVLIFITIIGCLR